jgi:hypothetical protein
MALVPMDNAGEWRFFLQYLKGHFYANGFETNGFCSMTQPHHTATISCGFAQVAKLLDWNYFFCNVWLRF